MPRPTPPSSCDAPRILLVSSNGSGMGHLTRLVAMGRRASPGTAVHLLSMSSAVPLAAGDLPYTYVPSADDMGISARRWNEVLRRRLDRTVRAFEPTVLVFDGTYPYRAVAELGRTHPHVRLVWSRRPMWRPGLGAAQLRLSSGFDLVLEPGELAASRDRGLTAGRSDALTVRPITLLDREELLDRPTARERLGLAPDARCVLVTLGAGSWHDVDSELGAVVAGLRAGDADAEICLVRPAIARSAVGLGRGVRAVSAYPLSRYLAAFDLVVTAAGYNTFHEAVHFERASAFVGVPAQMDDQPRRAAWADAAGVGLDLRPSEPTSVRALQRLVADDVVLDAMSARARAVWPGNGAREALLAVEAVSSGASREEVRHAQDEARATELLR